MIKRKLIFLLRKLDTQVSRHLFSVASVHEPVIRNEVIQSKVLDDKTDYNNELVIQTENFEAGLNLEINHKEQSDNNEHQAVVYKIKGNKMLGTPGGYVVYNRNEILIESCNHEEIYFWRYFSKMRLFFQIKRSARKNRKHLFLLEHQLDFNFWHLHVELIPQIAVILRSYFESNTEVRLTVIIGQLFSEKYVGMLKLIFQDKIEIVRNSGICYSAEYFYLTSPLYIRELRKNHKLQFRNFTFWSALKRYSDINLPIKGDIDKKEILLVSRRNTSSRRIINESEFVDHLINNGLNVRVVVLEELSWIEQLNCFKSASSIVAPHGAHSANLLYATPKTRYVELVSFKRKRGLFPIIEQTDICLSRGIDHIILDVGPAQNIYEDYMITGDVLKRLIFLLNYYD